MDQPKIVMLGSGGDKFVVGKQMRAAGGIAIHVGEAQLLIDPGPGALALAAHYGINVRETMALLVSHNHINHANDVNAIISAMTYDNLDKHGVFIGSESVVNGLDGVEPFLKKFYRNCVEKVLTMSPGNMVGVQSIDIRALKTKHSDPSAIGFRVSTPRFIISYSGDTAYIPELAEEYADSDILILNVLNPRGVRSENNLSVDDAIMLIQEVKPKLAIISHFGLKMMNANPLYEAREIQLKTGVQVMAAREGLNINPLSYSASLSQKSHNLYTS